MRRILQKIYYETLIGRPFMMLFHWIKTRIMPDKYYIKKRYRTLMGKELNLKDPKTLNEKISWLKLYDRTPLHTKCADKYAVRAYIAEKIGPEYLVPLYYHTNRASDINKDNITKIPCIIKTNHDSGGGIYIKDKSVVNWTDIQNTLHQRMKFNYYPTSKEWQYKNIIPCIIVEKLLQDSNGNIPLDYKLHCFNSKVAMCQVDIGRGTENHYRNWYSPSWEREPYSWSSPKGEGKFTDPSDKDVEKPATLKQMILLSEKLSQPFDYVRVDWYDVDGKLYFGELTFHHDGGNKAILPEEWDRILGDKLRLSHK